jgi:hypothetical protein
MREFAACVQQGVRYAVNNGRARWEGVKKSGLTRAARIDID